MQKTNVGSCYYKVGNKDVYLNMERTARVAVESGTLTGEYVRIHYDSGGFGGAQGFMWDNEDIVCSKKGDDIKKPQCSEVVRDFIKRYDACVHNRK